MGLTKELLETLKGEIRPSQNKIGTSYMQLVVLFPLQPITSKELHKVALTVIERLIVAAKFLKQEDDGIRVYLKTLAGLVADYESKNSKTGAVSGKEMLIYLMNLQGLNQKDLAKELGGQPIVSKILNGERELNLRQIRALAKRFKVSPEVFI
jgi:HTH-type transcriptional regulator/antitoxin HigA